MIEVSWIIRHRSGGFDFGRVWFSCSGSWSGCRNGCEWFGCGGRSWSFRVGGMINLLKFNFNDYHRDLMNCGSFVIVY